MSAKNKGFTLIEMSMVLVCIALLIGAIIIGESLLRNARLLSISSDIEMFKDAAVSFRDKYHYLPGDMPNATTFWGQDASCPNTPPNNLAKTQTCNGNGDGYVGDSNGSAFGGAINWQESYRFWQQLSNAGFTPSLYSGALSSRNTIGMDPGLNIPASKIQGNGYTMLYVLPGQATGTYVSNYNHVIIYGLPVNAQASAYGPGLTPSEALIIDQKIDDGKPNSGFVLTFTPDIELTQNCVLNDPRLGIIYNNIVKDLSCSLIFITGF